MIAENPDGKWAHYTQRLIRENDPYILKTSLTNAAYEGGFRGYQTAQETAEKYDINVPWLILMDPTSACNMHCTGCWAAEYGHKQSLTLKEMDRVLNEAKALGTHACLFTGGEPRCGKKDIIHLCEKHRDIAFHAFTNGTLIDEEFCQEMLRRHENSSGHWGFLRRAICRSYPAGSGPPAERGFRGLICYIKQWEGRIQCVPPAQLLAGGHTGRSDLPVFLRGSKALCLVNRNHIGDFLPGIEEAACPGARLDILVHLRADTTVLHGLLSVKMIVVGFLAAEILQHEHVAVILHFTRVILKSAVTVTYKRLFFHWMFLHIFPGLGPTLFVTALSACPITYYNLPTSDLSKKNLHIGEAYVIMRSRLQLPKIVV